MLRLVYSAEPKWLDLLDGLRVQVRPFTSALLAMARSAVNRAGKAESTDSAPDITIRFVLLTTELAKIAILDWSGVVDADDCPVPVSAESVAAMMDFWTVNDAFATQYVTPGLMMGVEKKDLAPLPNGILAGAPDIAADATVPATGAPIN